MLLDLYETKWDLSCTRECESARHRIADIEESAGNRICRPYRPPPGALTSPSHPSPQRFALGRPSCRRNPYPPIAKRLPCGSLCPCLAEDLLARGGRVR